MIVTLYENVTDTAVHKSADLTWDEVAGVLMRHTRRPDKDGHGWSPAEFRPGGKRQDADVVSVGALVLDLDKRPDGSPLDEVAAAGALRTLRTSGLRAVVHTTHSHAPPERCSLRAVVALSRAVPAADWSRFWAAAVARLGFHVEPACRNPGRFWYWPSAADGAPAEAVAWDGTPLDVDAVLAGAAPAEPAAPAAARAAGVLRIPEGGRDNALTSLAGTMRSRGMPEAAILAALEVVNATQCDPPLPAEALKRIARSIGRREPAQDVAGVAQFAQALGVVPTAPPREAWVGRDSIAALIMQRKDEPWISINVGDKVLDEVRAGSIVTLQGPTGAGKTSLVAEMLRAHCVGGGHGLVVSAELTGDEFGARMIGQELECYWKGVLRGEVPAAKMITALPERMHVIDMEGATLVALDAQLGRLRAEAGPEAAIMAVCDYGQILVTDGYHDGVRDKVAAVWTEANRLARKHRAVVVMLSQMSRAASKAARAGERLGADSMDGGAETAAIERWSTLVLEIGGIETESPDGWRQVALSVGKGRMSGGDRVIMMRYRGLTGRWEVVTESRPAAEVKEEARLRREHERVTADDALVFKAVFEAHRQGVYRSKEAWRTDHRPPDISATRVVDALARLASEKSPRLRLERRLSGHVQCDCYVPTIAPPLPDAPPPVPGSVATAFLK